MANFTDKINEGLGRLNTSPLGMAGLGLLLQPSMSFEPINPFEYAIAGMETGIKNKFSQEKARSEEEARRARLLMDVQRYQQEEMKMRMAQQEQARQAQAMQELMSTLSPEEARMAAVLGPKFAEQMMQQKSQAGRLPAARIQEYEEAKKGGFSGSFTDYLTFVNTRPVSPNYQAIPTERGMQVFDTRTGQIVSTQGLPPAQYSPSLQGEIAASKAAGTMEGEQRTAARLDLPSYLDSSKAMLSKVESLIKHPGMRDAVGAPSLGKAMMYVPGSDASNFMARLREVQGGQFLEAFKTLRGGGAITQTEGEKATQAISRMSTSQDEKEFVTAANEFRRVVLRGMERAQARASGSPQSTENNATPTDSGEIQYPRGTVRERGK